MEYFKRDKFPGKFSLCENSGVAEDYTMNLWNGTATLTVYLPSEVKVGGKLNYYSKLEDETRVEPFINEFVRYIVEAKDIPKPVFESRPKKE